MDLKTFSAKDRDRHESPDVFNAKSEQISSPLRVKP